MTLNKLSEFWRKLRVLLFFLLKAVNVEERARDMLVDAHYALGGLGMLFLDMVPDNDFIHQLAFFSAYLLVAALGAR